MLKGLFIFLLFICSSTYGQHKTTNSNGSDKFIIDSFDLNNYSEIPRVKKLNGLFGDSYQFYFRVNANSFRLIHIWDTTFPQTTFLQMLTKKKWQNRLAFYNYNHFSDLILKDVNNDGFLDILRQTKWYEEIYLFNSKANNFIDSVCGNRYEDTYLLDTVKNIYCDIFYGKMMCNDINTYLYTYRNFNKYYLYKLDIENCDDEEHEFITGLTLLKNIKGQEELNYIEREIKFKKKKKIDDNLMFYLHNYWKKNYKKLLGYS